MTGEQQRDDRPGDDRPGDEQRTAEQDRAREEWRRKRRLAEIFGDVLPETTGDEREGRDRREGGDPGEDWLRSQVPPHHGG